MAPLCAFALLVLRGQTPVTAQQIVDNVRKAVHYEAMAKHPRGLQFKGAAHFYGEDAEYTLLVSPRGEFLSHLAGPLAESTGFDGKIGWNTDSSGATTTLGQEEKDQTILSMAVDLGRWVDPAAGFEVTLAPNGVASDTFTVRVGMANSVMVAEVTVDGKTWLPSAAKIQASDGLETTLLGDYREEQGLVLAHTIADSHNGITNTLKITSVEDAPIFIRNPYELPGWRVSDTKFDRAHGASTVMRRAVSGHILVHPLINGEDLGWFILDTGAGGVAIDAKTADTAKLPSAGEIPEVGVGGAVMGHFRKVARLQLGPMTVTNLQFHSIDLEPIGNAFGIKLAGVLGYDVFRRSVLELDLASLRLAIYDPAAYALKGAKWQAMQFAGRTPVISARFAQHEGLFRLDTGAALPVIFHSPAVDQFHLSANQQLQDAGLGGVGGSTAAKIGHVDSFESPATSSMHRPWRSLQAAPGYWRTSTWSARLGRDSWMPFTMVFDYGSSRIAFLPTAKAGK